MSFVPSGHDPNSEATDHAPTDSIRAEILTDHDANRRGAEPPTRLQDYLLRNSTITQAVLERAKSVADETGEALANVLTRLGLLSERDLAEAFVQITHWPLASPGDYPREAVLSTMISTRFLKDARIIPLLESDGHLAVAAVDPLNTESLDAVRFAAGRPLKVFVTYPGDFDAAFDRLYGDSSAGITTEAEEPNASVLASDDVDRLKDIASEAPVIKLVQGLITKAVEARASDIHIEPMESELRTRYRIDGVLVPIAAPPLRLAPAIVSRVKIMAKLNIAERRLAQDGRIKLAIRGKDIDCRVSTAPTIHGESVVLRVLDRGSLKLDFGELGFESDLIRQLRQMLGLPHGIVLVTGPTGSGKTTTLYAALLELNTPERKILTIEDPIEYRLDGINQVQVKPQIGLTFANALRSFLRQDPDVMMVGEIRDLETAQVAVQAALTGHLILSTIHTNDAASTIARLIDMGVENYLIAATLNGIAAQRLVRKLCISCREPYSPVPGLLNSLGVDAGNSAITLYRAVGCEACGGSGYSGRTAILELLPVSDRIRRSILQNDSIDELRHAAAEAGMRTMQVHGIAKALRGITSLEEVLRVSQ